MRTVKTYTGACPRGKPRTVTVRWYSEFEEYVCEVTDDGVRHQAVDYYTTERQDAFDTAASMTQWKVIP